MVAGLFKENVGTIEKPLLVMPTEPEKVETLWVLSGDCPKLVCETNAKRTKKKIVFMYFI
jgi:hypothetical protein